MSNNPPFVAAMLLLNTLFVITSEVYPMKATPPPIKCPSASLKTNVLLVNSMRWL